MSSVFECARCNALTYSASREAVSACERCGSTTARVLDAVTFAAAESTPRIPAPGDHCLTVVADDDEAVRVALPFLRDGLLGGERVFAWLRPARCAQIEAQLPAEAARRLECMDAEKAYASPFDALATVERVVAVARDGGPPVRIVGGPPGTLTDLAPAAEWARYEALAHEAAVSEGITALCVYDASSLDSELREMVHRTHPLIGRHDEVRRNPDFAWTGA